MRKSMFMALAGLALVLMPVTAEAKRYNGEGGMKNRSITGYARKSYSQKSSKSRKRSASNGGGCLSSEARALLGRIQSRFGNVQIISTCRPGARIATSGKPSKHASGQAIDFRVPGRKKEVVNWLINNHHSGGIMTYSDMDHVHVDVGYRFVALNRPSGH